MAGYVAELAEVRSRLDDRYDDLKFGRVQPVDAAEALARPRARSEARRAERRG